DGNVLQGKMLGFLGVNLLITLAVTLPVFLIVSRTATFKIAGPLHRMETHLRQVIREQSSGPCVIRKDDELQDFCALLNKALEVPRGQGTEVSLAAELPLDCEQIPPALPSEGTPTGAEIHAESNTRGGTAPQEGLQ
ncbi:MAG: hypothetical protein L3K26_12450, partial [Candidatus Hydrogenedentes bacterium]|nr:hypothetical protein [Candidatus Hydrogenedentota bacterium]